VVPFDEKKTQLVEDKPQQPTIELSSGKGRRRLSLYEPNDVDTVEGPQVPEYSRPPNLAGPFLLHPDGMASKCVDVTVGLVIICLLAVVPVRLSFDLDEETDDTLQIVSTFCDCVFIANIAFKFRTAYFKHHKLVTDSYQIALKYLRGWLVVDVMVAIPWELTFQPLGIVSLLRVVSLTKLVLRPMSSGTPTSSNPWHVLIKLIIFISLLAHMLGCVFWVVVKDHTPDTGLSPPQWLHDSEVVTQYLWCFFWALQALNGCGVNFTPERNGEILFCIFIQLAAMLILGYFVGNIVKVIETINASAIRYEMKMNTVDDWAKHRKMPSHIKDRILRFHQAELSQTGGHDEVGLMNELPTCLRQDVSNYQCQKLLEGSSFLSLMPHGFQSSVLSLLRPQVIAESEVVIREGDMGDCMYFLQQGSVEVFVGSKSIATLHDGDCFGETALLERSVRTASVVSTAPCYLFLLGALDFERVLSYNTHVGQIMKAISYVRKNYEASLKVRLAMDRMIYARKSSCYNAVHQWFQNAFDMCMESDPPACTTESATETLAIAADSVTETLVVAADSATETLAVAADSVTETLAVAEN